MTTIQTSIDIKSLEFKTVLAQAKQKLKVEHTKVKAKLDMIYPISEKTMHKIGGLKLDKDDEEEIYRQEIEKAGYDYDEVKSWPDYMIKLEDALNDYELFDQIIETFDLSYTAKLDRILHTLKNPS